MLLDFRKLFASCEAPIVRNLSFDLSHESFPGYTVEMPVQAVCTLSPEGAAIRLQLQMSATVHAPCARCLTEVTQPFTARRDFRIRDGEWESDSPEGNDLPFAPDGKLDLQELVYTELVLEIPTVLLCNTECAGLCPVCGERKPCSCKRETSTAIDERLLPLQQLLTD